MTPFGVNNLSIIYLTCCCIIADETIFEEEMSLIHLSFFGNFPIICEHKSRSGSISSSTLHQTTPFVRLVQLFSFSKVFRHQFPVHENVHIV